MTKLRQSRPNVTIDRSVFVFTNLEGNCEQTQCVLLLAPLLIHSPCCRSFQLRNDSGCNMRVRVLLYAMFEEAVADGDEAAPAATPSKSVSATTSAGEVSAPAQTVSMSDGESDEYLRRGSSATMLSHSFIKSQHMPPPSDRAASSVMAAARVMQQRHAGSGSLKPHETPCAMRVRCDPAAMMVGERKQSQAFSLCTSGRFPCFSCTTIVAA